ncbi:tRNA (adenosine(37)-N6)-threonylcarbamoyltransferase complex dimerization subunit type 1 TsaB [Pontiella agarivorans]|uniref:tRNA (Adenosine(37)-N6)-threonylcarbamoyltransferase complex dimerization subunit type 1 TsaB n=1 Tax=Pontiella agarivorans TaxID=3038953 RepID=A0ABU5MZT5_9BACT|nr:tRNA (adenosine(37)-N6)-threonylcarbamoyltransferase complex dimerization subunit type 1 TsaB [Pontiella agarivorans]MDZ8119673.1 tRNA (adenosine(37)-N6)-threonylcarbamoyltransferase complex dimerization subunit type 1 TsaB [Pontiella agarivorans]
MKIFSIELSSKFGSIAVLEKDDVIAEKSWEENFKNRQQLFDAMAELETDWDSVDLFAVGRGPGAFSGMRIGFTVVNALAAPLKKKIYALNSGAALAAQCGAKKTVVVGDARRNKVWAGIFNGSEIASEFRLMERDELTAFVPEDAVVVSPDQDRLAELLVGFQGLEEPHFPTAGTLGGLVYDRFMKGIESEAYEPLYMHPPVFIEPRFPE